MDIQEAHDLQIRDSQFSDVHGDQNIHHHGDSVQMDGQNNTAVFNGGYHEEDENCSNMVIYAQGQNCQVTLDAVDLPFLMNRNRHRNRQRTPQNPSSPLRNGNQFDVPTVEGQNDVGTAATAATSNANYHQSHNTIINNTTGPMTVIGQGDNSQVYSGVSFVPPPQPPPTFQQSPESLSHPSYNGVPVESSRTSSGDQHTSTEDKAPPTTTLETGSDSVTSSAGSAHVVERNGTTALPIFAPVPVSPRSSAVSVPSAFPPVATTPPSLITAKAAEQMAANGIYESLPTSLGAPPSFQAAYVASSEELQHNPQAQQLYSDVAGIPTEATVQEPVILNTATAGSVSPSVGEVSPLPGVRSSQTHQMPQENTTGSDASVPKPVRKMDPHATNGIVAPVTEISPSQQGPRADPLLGMEDTSQRILSNIATPQSNKRKKNILRLLQHRFLRLFKGWKNG